MLLSLHIENIAVIKKIDLDFSGGFSVLTGETGAGKSIIIDSINLLLGTKADRELIRTGAPFAMVSGFFAQINESALAALADAGVYPDDDGNILIQRTVYADGKSQIKINGRTVTLSILRGVSASLISIHGQNDTSDIANTEKQLEIIDSYSNNASLLDEYRLAYEELEALRKEISEIRAKESERERLTEILEYQIKDIDSYGLYDGEEEELIDKKIKIRNSEKISKNAGFVFKALKGSEKGRAFLMPISAQPITAAFS